MTKFFRLLLMGSLFFTVLSCSDDYQGPIPYPTLIQAADQAGLTTLVTAVRAIPGLEATLQDQDAITVFAPTNEAFAAALEVFGASDLNELVTKIGGPANLEKVLGFHVVPAVALSSSLQATNTFTTLSGQEIIVERAGGTV
ncbi:MAG: fasciclin, partial [Algoriphagus sp. 32-45-6]